MFHHLTTGAKIEFENQVLSAGRDCLPPCAVAVLDGCDATPEYWDFIAEQFELALHSAAGDEVEAAAFEAWDRAYRAATGRGEAPEVASRIGNLAYQGVLYGEIPEVAIDRALCCLR